MISPNTSFKEMIERADAQVVTLSPGEVAARLDKPGVVLLDIRDVRELEHDGKIPGSYHIPRGMLEFWIHPESPYFRDYFRACSELVIHCNRGWRSALAACTLKNLGIEASHMSGGYSEWQGQGWPTEDYSRK